jgi:hypothetical protein
LKIVYKIIFLLIGIGSLGFASIALTLPSSVGIKIMGVIIPPWAAAIAVGLTSLSPSFSEVATGSPLPELIKDIVSIIRKNPPPPPPPPAVAVVVLLFVIVGAFYSCTTAPTAIPDSTAQRQQIDQTVSDVNHATDAIKKDMKNHPSPIMCNDPDILTTLNDCRSDLVRAKSSLDTAQHKMEADQSAMAELESLRSDAETWRAIKRNTLIAAIGIIVTTIIGGALYLYLKTITPKL